MRFRRLLRPAGRRSHRGLELTAAGELNLCRPTSGVGQTDPWECGMSRAPPQPPPVSPPRWRPATLQRLADLAAACRPTSRLRSRDPSASAWSPPERHSARSIQNSGFCIGRWHRRPDGARRVGCAREALVPARRNRSRESPTPGRRSARQGQSQAEDQSNRRPRHRWRSNAVTRVTEPALLDHACSGHDVVVTARRAEQQRRLRSTAQTRLPQVRECGSERQPASSPGSPQTQQPGGSRARFPLRPDG
jgi:hypothetical protein